MTGSFRIIYHRRIGMTHDTEVCACTLGDLWNVNVKPITELADAGDVKSWTVRHICDFVAAHMRLGERMEVFCAGVDWPPEQDGERR